MHLRRLVLPLLAAGLLTTGCVVIEGELPGGGASAPSPGSPPPVEGGASEDEIARAVFDRVNDERRERGLEPVQWSDELATTARDWSEQMSRTGAFEHQDVRSLLEERTTGLTALGENIFTSSGPAAAGVLHVGWMRSDTHRLNVLSPGWDRLGVGVECAEDGSVWATQHFGRTAGSDLPGPSDDVPPEEPVARPEEDGPSC